MLIEETYSTWLSIDVLNLFLLYSILSVRCIINKTGKFMVYDYVLFEDVQYLLNE